MKQNPEIDLAFEFVQNTNRNLFLTGKAGTGKTTFLHQLKEVLPKRMVVVAPTGVAAINAGGVTIHSFFQMPFGPILPGSLTNQNNNREKNAFIRKFNKKKINIIRTLDLLVIDEISMVRADLLDGIDQILRKYKNPQLPFGGTQVLMIGDLQQLAPVAKEAEWNLLKDHYDTIYFFSSKVFQKADFLGIELKHIYRQQDNEFIKLLNEIRDNRLTKESFALLSERYQPGFSPKNGEGYITLTTHNATANRINEQQLKTVEAPINIFEAEVNGNFPEYSFPTDQFLSLKEGAQVMFVKNDSSPEKRYFNGKIGIVTDFDENMIYIQCQNEDSPIAVEQESWENIRYSINPKTKNIAEEITGSFIQYPLRLAWAITIHKSQGLTFDKAVIDAQAAFAHGQTYVALSRCKTLEGLILRSQLTSDAIITDKTVGEFNQQVYDNPPDENTLLNSKRLFVLNLLEDLFSFRQIDYHINKAISQTNANETVIHGNFQSPLTKMHHDGSKFLDEISKKFIIQLRQISTSQDNDHFQERIKKASSYFLGQIKNQLIKPLEEISFETDNQQLRKTLREVLTKIYELTRIKQACFENTVNGFEIKEYLHIRAMAALDKADKSSAARKESEPEVSQNPGLFNSLRKWRHALADERSIPAFYIFSQKALIGISNELPATLDQLHCVKGVGPKKVEEYGEPILEMVLIYCAEKDIELRTDQPKKKKKKKKTSKIPTKEITKSLWVAGKNIKEIADERSLTTGTIEGHLAYYIGNGELKVEEFVDANKIKTICSAIENNPEVSLTEVKETLGNSITWRDIRFINQHLKYLNKQNHS